MEGQREGDGEKGEGGERRREERVQRRERKKAKKGGIVRREEQKEGVGNGKDRRTKSNEEMKEQTYIRHKQ